jgi:hypothetical protein
LPNQADQAGEHTVTVHYLVDDYPEERPTIEPDTQSLTFTVAECRIQQLTYIQMPALYIEEGV